MKAKPVCTFLLPLAGEGAPSAVGADEGGGAKRNPPSSVATEFTLGLPKAGPGGGDAFSPAKSGRRGRAPSLRPNLAPREAALPAALSGHPLDHAARELDAVRRRGRVLGRGVGVGAVLERRARRRAEPRDREPQRSASRPGG